MKQEIPKPVLVLLGVLAIGVVVWGVLSISQQPDGSKLQKDDYKYEPGEMKKKMEEEAQANQGQ